MTIPNDNVNEVVRIKDSIESLQIKKIKQKNE